MKKTFKLNKDSMDRAKRIIKTFIGYVNQLDEEEQKELMNKLLNPYYNAEMES